MQHAKYHSRASYNRAAHEDGSHAAHEIELACSTRKITLMSHVSLVRVTWQKYKNTRVLPHTSVNLEMSCTVSCKLLSHFSSNLACKVMYMQGIKYLTLIEICPVVIEIWGVENGDLAVPVNNTLVCHMSSLAADRPCVLIPLRKWLQHCILPQIYAGSYINLCMVLPYYKCIFYIAMYHFAWADQRPVQGNISYIAKQPGQYARNESNI